MALTIASRSNCGIQFHSSLATEPSIESGYQILADNGSVQNLPAEVLPEEDKEVFLTFSEVNQLGLVQQAAIRQKYIDQTQSLNLCFDPTDSPRWINQVHLEAWKLGVKTLYYLRTDSVIKGDLGSRVADCVSCDG